MNPVEFTPAQARAFEVSERRQDTCIVAGPGSGKTTVLVEYFRRLVEAGADPLRILAITFTEKAAANMRKKLAGQFSEQTGMRGALERAWVSTVHGFCARLLRENAVAAAVDPEFAIADQADAVRLQYEAMAEAMDELFAARPAEVRALIRALASFEFEEAVLAAYDAMRGAGLGIEAVAALPAPADDTLARIAVLAAELRAARPDHSDPAIRQQLEAAREATERLLIARTPREKLAAVQAFAVDMRRGKRNHPLRPKLIELKELVGEKAERPLLTAYHAPERGTLFEILRRFDRIYRDRKTEAGLLDFADLEEAGVRLLGRHPETRRRVQAQFDHILMDEFQDTNGQQARLLELVRSPGCFYAVGDINQAIFGFRHAEPEVFRRYRQQVAGRGERVVELAENFRSRADILHAVETVADGAQGIEPRSFDARRAFRGPRDVSVEAAAFTAPDTDAAQLTEARWIARRIVDLVSDEGFRFEDVAVLVRNTEVLGTLADALDEAAVPYVVNRGRGFYEAGEVADLSNLLRVVANPRDEVALAAVLRSPLVGVSDEGLLALRLLGSETGASDPIVHTRPSGQAAEHARQTPNLAAALATLTQAHTIGFSPDDFASLDRFRRNLAQWRRRREAVSFDRLLVAAMDDAGYPAGERAGANIDKFLAMARAASGRGTLDEFVDELARLRLADPREPDAPPDDSSAAVKLMTIHSAKGLEFPVVFIAALHKGVRNSAPVVAFSPTIGLGARWRNPVTAEDHGDLFHTAIGHELTRRESEESARLLYVAMTRAEELLVMSFASGARRSSWAELVAGKLQADLAPGRDEILERTGPDGSRWKLRLVTADRAPELRLAQQIAADAVPSEQTEWLAPPVVTAQQDSAAAVTDLAEFARCPRRYLLGRYLGFAGRVKAGAAECAEPATVEMDAAELGTAVHRLLACLDVPNPDPEALRLADVFRRGPLGRRLAKAVRVEREFGFLMALGGLVLRGQVDLWFEENGEVVIVDYKTDAVTSHQAHRHAEDYALQLRLYAMAVEQAAGRKVSSAWLHFLQPDTVVGVDLEPPLWESPAGIAAEMEQAQDKMEFPLREGDHCRRCPFYRDLCPAGR
ncbi:MAG: UvrD-helicase domain-containing protein [Bryobacteraceae bacterium]|jgi:ATP-dependent exoDNAse (exonuclease V) beta subunit